MINRIALTLLVAWQAATCRSDDEEGQTLAEYGLIMAVIAVAVVVGAGILFRSALIDQFTDASNCLNRTTCAY